MQLLHIITMPYHLCCFRYRLYPRCFLDTFLTFSETLFHPQKKALRTFRKRQGFVVINLMNVALNIFAVSLPTVRLDTNIRNLI